MKVKISGGLLKNNFERFELEDSHQVRIEEVYGDSVNQEFLDSWHRAIANSGTPLDFADGHDYSSSTIWFDGIPFSSVSMQGIDRDYRKKVIQGAAQHQPQKDLNSYGREFDEDCMLDKNIVQALDALPRDSIIETNALAIFDDKFAWIVNKFPYNIGGTLLLPIAHDDLTNRASFDKETTEWTKSSDSQTRGAIISNDFLSVVVATCDSYDQTAQRNHALDGMSIPLHDHFKLMPQANPSLKVIDNLIRQELVEGNEAIAYRPKNTPFDTLCICGSNKKKTVEIAQEVLAKLEKNDEIFTVVYHKGHFLITPRKKELFGNGNKDGWTGSTVGMHGVDDPEENPDHLRRIKKYVAPKASFEWGKYIGDLEPSSLHKEILVKTKSAFSLDNYSPINYDDFNIGEGQLLKAANLDPSVIALYEKLLEKQDKRSDKGHAETVTYLTSQLSKLLKVPDFVQEEACLAAVLHDTGYADIENIEQRFAENEANKLSADANIRDQAIRDDAEIRKLHQDNAVVLAKEYLGAHKSIQVISDIVGDHDTRINPPRSLSEAIMRDADMLARVTRTNLKSFYSRFGANTPPEVFVRQSEAQLVNSYKTGFYFPESLQIARIEFASTLKEIYKGTIPKDLVDIYSKELKILSSSK